MNNKKKKLRLILLEVSLSSKERAIYTITLQIYFFVFYLLNKRHLPFKTIQKR